MWNYVIPHFSKFLEAIELKPEEREDAEGKADRIARRLALKYYPTQIYNPNWLIKVGSYGKGTACRPRSDLDMLFVLPDEDCGRIQGLQGNKQSQLLREVRECVRLTFPTTDLKADGQVVIAPFTTYEVDIVPAFALGDGRFLIAHTIDGGSWRVTNPGMEYNDIVQADRLSAGKSTHLNKMVKVWKRECNVEMKSIFLEIMVNKFVSEWQYKDRTIFYYDWMVRDFFTYMLRWLNGRAIIAGTEQWIELGNCWESKTRSALARAQKACDYEHKNQPYSATDEWQKIFGYQFRGSSRLLEELLRA